MKVTYKNYILEKKDELNWQVIEIRVTKAGPKTKPENVGRKYEVALGWYPTLEMAALDLARTVADSDPDAFIDFRAYAARLAEVGAEIVNAVTEAAK
jgi:hypothetical protein